LKANKIPHPQTDVFYFEKEALDWLNSPNVKFPIVAKTNIGASGSGVVIIETKEELQNLLQKSKKT
jgi:carbamoylphosphate synthase large subunit